MSDRHTLLYSVGFFLSTKKPSVEFTVEFTLETLALWHTVHEINIGTLKFLMISPLALTQIWQNL